MSERDTPEAPFDGWGDPTKIAELWLNRMTDEGHIGHWRHAKVIPSLANLLTAERQVGADYVRGTASAQPCDHTDILSVSYEHVATGGRSGIARWCVACGALSRNEDQPYPSKQRTWRLPARRRASASHLQAECEAAIVTASDASYEAGVRDERARSSKATPVPSDAFATLVGFARRSVEGSEADVVEDAIARLGTELRTGSASPVETKEQIQEAAWGRGRNFERYLWEEKAALNKGKTDLKHCLECSKETDGVMTVPACAGCVMAVRALCQPFEADGTLRADPMRSGHCASSVQQPDPLLRSEAPNYNERATSEACPNAANHGPGWTCVVCNVSEPRSGEAQPDDVRRANEWLDRWQPGDEEPNLLSPLLALLAEARTDERKLRERGPSDVRSDLREPGAAHQGPPGGTGDVSGDAVDIDRPDPRVDREHRGGPAAGDAAPRAGAGEGARLDGAPAHGVVTCSRCGGDGWLRCADADCPVCMADNYCEDSVRCPNGCATTRARSGPNACVACAFCDWVLPAEKLAEHVAKDHVATPSSCVDLREVRALVSQMTNFMTESNEECPFCDEHPDEHGVVLDEDDEEHPCPLGALEDLVYSAPAGQFTRPDPKESP